jgi:threonylcarbamoyladenosine tRNA methylthiotransferase MtaB
MSALGVDGLIPNADKLDARAWNVPAAPLVVPSGQHTRAFVAVQNGCDHACTFCIIPAGRGPSRSRSIAEVVAEVRAHVDQGIMEIVLTAVDLTGWSRGGLRLGHLVAAILRDVPELPRLRLSSLDGVEIDPCCARSSQEARVMPHLHLSLQHGADLILKRMKRRHLRADAVELVTDLTARRPDIAVGADLIAGFPTEGEAEHADNLSIIEALGIVHGHIFPSARARPPRRAHAASAAPRRHPARRRIARRRGGSTRPLAERADRPPPTRSGRARRHRSRRKFRPHRSAPGTAAGQIIAITPTHISEGLLA